MSSNISNQIKKLLNYAADEGHVEIINILLKRAVNEISREDKVKALRHAAKQDYREVVNTLYRVGNDITIEDKGKALQWAMIKGNFEVVNILLDSLDDKIALDDQIEILNYAEGEHDIAEINNLLERVFSKIIVQNKVTPLNGITKDNFKNTEHDVEKGNFEWVLGKHTARYFNQDCDFLTHAL